MKILLLLGCMFIGSIGYCQKKTDKITSLDSAMTAARENTTRQLAKDSLKRAAKMAVIKQHKIDSFIMVLHTTLNIPKEKAAAVMQIVDESISKMDVNAKDHSVKGEEKVNRFKAIARDRDDKIAALLSEDQIKTLKEIMKRNRQQAQSAAPALPPARQ